MNNLSNKQLMNQMLVGFYITQGISVAAELGIADLLIDEPHTAKELAKKTKTDSDALYRVLRALASFGIFAEDSQGRFGLTPLAEYLRSDNPDSSRAFAIMAGAEFYQLMGQLSTAVRTGKDVLGKVFGKTFFEYMVDNPERHRIYDSAMTGVHDSETQPMLEAYDFSQFRTIVDIGGGNGRLLTAILKRHPNMKGILFDLPAVADGARATIDAANLSDRCEIVGGDFFSSIPSGYDAYLMRHVIHDWQDNDVISILSNCKKAMKSDSRILVVESVIPDGNGPGFGKWLDLMMLLVNGRERTEQQFQKLFSRAGLNMKRIIPTGNEVSVIEGILETKNGS